MTFNERHASANRTRNSGPLERVRFGREESGEKSLLDLIEERSADRSPGERPDDRNGFLGQDIDEAYQPDMDQMILRLGGNGF